MNETIKNEEALKEVNPVDEYLKNYKEQKLAEFFVFRRTKRLRTVRKKDRNSWNRLQI